MLQLKPADDTLLVYAQFWHEDEDTNYFNGFERGGPGQVKAKQFLEKAVLDPPDNFTMLGLWDGPTPVGYIGFSKIDEQSRSANLHVTISPEHRGEGYGRKGLELALDKAFSSGLYRATFKPIKTNKVACGLARSMGFTLEAFTKSSCWIGTTPHDQAQFRMLRVEWERLKESD